MMKSERGKTPIKKNIGRYLISPLAVLSISGCNLYNSDLSEAKKLVKKGSYKVSLSYFENATKLNPSGAEAIEAAHEGLRISLLELKDHQRAAYFLKHLILFSKDPVVRLNSQRQLADIYFENLQDYGSAVIELNKLLQFQIAESEQAELRMKLARAYYFIKDFLQSKSEVVEIKKLKASAETKFAARVLLGNINLAERNFNDAIKTFKEIIVDYPKESERERIPMNLVVCYEEIQDYKAAIDTLIFYREKFSNQDYIEIKIKRLRERLKNQPGAKGLRK